MYTVNFKQQAMKVTKDTCAERGVASLENMDRRLPAKSIVSASSAADEEDELFAAWLYDSLWYEPKHNDDSMLSREQSDSCSKMLSNWCNNEASCSSGISSSFSSSNLGFSLGSPPCIDFDLDLDGDEGWETDCDMCCPLFSQNSVVASAPVPSPSSGIYSPAATMSRVSSFCPDTSCLETVGNVTNIPNMQTCTSVGSNCMPISKHYLDSRGTSNEVGY
jgi:hypothetical protein